MPPLKSPPAAPAEPMVGSFEILPLTPVDIDVGGTARLPVMIKRTNYARAIVLEVIDQNGIGLKANTVEIAPNQSAGEVVLEVGPRAQPGKAVAMLNATGRDDKSSLENPVREQFGLTLKVPSTPVTAPTPPKRINPPQEPMSPVVNYFGIRLVWIKPGTFSMGSPPKEPERDPRDEQAHDVTLTHGFYLSAFEVTQEQYQKVMTENPSTKVDPRVPKPGANPVFIPAGGSFGDAGPPRLPVESVTYAQAVEFCRRISTLPEERIAGRYYRLPTEAEWEYACRAETKTAYSWGASWSDLRTYAWHRENSNGAPQIIGAKKPNKWGLYDMHGNVAEWCADWYSPDYYKMSPPQDPTGPEIGDQRVVRGGAFLNDAQNRFQSSHLLRCAKRMQEFPGQASPKIGFRVACDLVEPVAPDKAGALPPVLKKP
jgi:formylglycine-generating enzyme required for sulfatase activity